MEPITGRECPECGCPGGTVLRRYKSWGALQLQLGCGDCGKTWRAKDEGGRMKAGGNGVVYPVMRCPQCNSRKTHVTSTQAPIRYHKCDDCGHAFKSVEDR